MVVMATWVSRPSSSASSHFLLTRRLSPPLQPRLIKSLVVDFHDVLSLDVWPIR